MEFPRIFNVNLRLIWAKCYLKNRRLHWIQAWFANLLLNTDWFSAIIIFHGPNSLIGSIGYYLDFFIVRVHVVYILYFFGSNALMWWKVSSDVWNAWYFNDDYCACIGVVVLELWYCELCCCSLPLIIIIISLSDCLLFSCPLHWQTEERQFHSTVHS